MSGFDTIVLGDGDFEQVEYLATGPQSGFISRDGDVLSYFGVEPITDATGGVKTFAATEDPDLITVLDGGIAGDGSFSIEGFTFENVEFTNASTITSLTIDGLGGDDIIDVQALDSNFKGDLLIQGNLGRDEVKLTAPALDPWNPTLLEDADFAPGAILPVGTDVVWTYLISNGGTSDLVLDAIVDDAGTPLDVSDDFVPVGELDANGFNIGDANQDGRLNPNETWLFTSDVNGEARYQASPGQYVNAVTVIAEELQTQQTYIDSDLNHHVVGPPEIDIEKGIAFPVTNKGNNGVGNGEDPQPPGEPPINDGEGTSPGNPGNTGNGKGKKG